MGIKQACFGYGITFFKFARSFPVSPIKPPFKGVTQRHPLFLGCSLLNQVRSVHAKSYIACSWVSVKY